MNAAAGAAVVLLLMGIPASAHRLDEYLQAALISVDSGRVEAQIRLIPGVAVFPAVMAGIDTDGDGAISEGEQSAYAERVVRDLSLTIDGIRLRPRLVSMMFPGIEDMRTGLGEIQLTVTADLPRNGGPRRLVFENRHQSRIGAYLVNCLAPSDSNIAITAQKRNYSQSFYELDYVQAGAAVWRPGAEAWFVFAAVLLFSRLILLWRKRVQSAPPHGRNARSACATATPKESALFVAVELQRCIRTPLCRMRFQRGTIRKPNRSGAN